MGVTGTDVTKNVADMVLADDNFATIVGAVEEGRRIYDNIQRAIKFLLGSNMSEVLSIFTATMLGFTILEPVHLLWINLLTEMCIRDRFMAEKLAEYQRDGSYQYVLAFEESYGYMMGDYVRDKDAVTACVMITEMAAYYFEQGMTLAQALDALYEKYGFYRCV